MKRVVDAGRETVILGVTVLYGLFIFHFLFPDAYRRLLAWLAVQWASIAALFERRTDVDQLNRLWEIGE